MFWFSESNWISERQSSRCLNFHWPEHILSQTINGDNFSLNKALGSSIWWRRWVISECDIRGKVVTLLCDVRERHYCFICHCRSLKKNKSLNVHHTSILPHNLTNLYLSLTWEPLHEISITSKVIFHICQAYTDRDTWSYPAFCTNTWGSTYSYLLRPPPLDCKPSPNHKCITSCS